MKVDEKLVQLRLRVDGHFDAALARTPGAFACAPGCDSCCRPGLSVFEVEAAPIRAALAELGQRDPAVRERVRAQGRASFLDHCALLVDGRCSIYEQRPILCRSHGLPVAFSDPEDPEALRVDHCPLNFRNVRDAESIPRASILVLDALNQPLAVIAELAHPGSRRIALAELATLDDKTPSE